MSAPAPSFREALRTLRAPKLALACFAAAIATAMIALAYGALHGDLVGQLAFALIFDSLLTTIATAISLRTPPSFFKVVRAVWLGMSLMVLGAACAMGSNGRDTVLTYAMTLLGFPASLLFAPLLGSWMGDAINHVSGLVAFWLGLAFAGYSQWFLVLGRLGQSRQEFKEKGRPPA